MVASGSPDFLEATCKKANSTDASHSSACSLNRSISPNNLYTCAILDIALNGRNGTERDKKNTCLCTVKWNRTVTGFFLMLTVFLG